MLMELRGNFYNLLDEVLVIGILLEINWGGKCLWILLVEELDKFKNLVYCLGVIIGDLEELVIIDWEGEIEFDLFWYLYCCLVLLWFNGKVFFFG